MKNQLVVRNVSEATTLPSADRWRNVVIAQIGVELVSGKE